MNKITKDTLIALVFFLPVFIYKFVSIPSPHFITEGIFILLLFSPVVEELIFRGIILETTLNFLKPKINRYALVANIAVSILFALAHIAVTHNIASLLVFFPSLALGWHYGRNRNVPLVILIHSFYNITALIA